MAVTSPPPTTEYLHWSGKPIGFTQEDHPPQVPRLGHSAMILPAVVEGYDVSRIFIDGGSSLNLIYADTLRKMNIYRANLTPTNTRLHGITPEKPIILWPRLHSTCSLEHEKISGKRSWSSKSSTGRHSIMPSWDDPHTPGSWLCRTTHTCYGESLDLRAQ
jgi:hypothetical protein